MLYQSLGYSEKKGFTVLYSGHLDLESGVQTVTASVRDAKDNIGGVVVEWQQDSVPSIAHRLGRLPEFINIPNDYSVAPMLSEFWDSKGSGAHK